MRDGHDDKQASSPEGPVADPAFAVVLKGAKQGDSVAFAQLYESMNQRVHGFARLRGADDPEALVNDVFLKVFRGLDSFEGNEPQFKAWVFTIARNVLIDEKRRAARRPVEAEFDDAAVAIRSGTSDTAAEAMDSLAKESVARLLDTLTPDQRDVVMLRVVADLTLEATAEALGKPITAVKALQRRAFRRLGDEISTTGVSL